MESQPSHSDENSNPLPSRPSSQATHRPSKSKKRSNSLTPCKLHPMLQPCPTPTSPSLSKRRSLQLTQEQKYPQILIQHHLLDHLQNSNASRHSSRSIRELENTEAIEEKEENQENQEGVGKIKVRDGEIQEKEEQGNEVEGVVRECERFLGREQREGYLEFAKTIRPYLEIRIKPKAVNQIGQNLLSNGLFLVAFIKYISLPEVSEDKSADDQAERVKSSMFDLFKKEYKIQTNKDQFDSAYQKHQQEQKNRLQSLLTYDEPKTQTNCKRDITQSKYQGTKKSSKKKSPSNKPSPKQPAPTLPIESDNKP